MGSLLLYNKTTNKPSYNFSCFFLNSYQHLTNKKHGCTKLILPSGSLMMCSQSLVRLPAIGLLAGLLCMVLLALCTSVMDSTSCQLVTTVPCHSQVVSSLLSNITPLMLRVCHQFCRSPCATQRHSFYLPSKLRLQLSKSSKNPIFLT